MFKILNIVLLEPEIPANTGNIGRTCVITGSKLHLIRPLGFQIDDKSIKRAGMDYWSSIDLHVWDSWDHFIKENANKRLFFATTKTENKYSDMTYQEDDFFIFGPESRGIPVSILKENPETCITIPMKHHPQARSLNLSNSVSVVLYEALRQLNFKGL